MSTRCLFACVLAVFSCQGNIGAPNVNEEGQVLMPALARYPVVLLHGMAGWDQIGPLEYFQGIPAALRTNGYEVFTPRVDPFQSTELRAQQLAQAIDDILQKTQAKKVTLIGHSQGGLDGRYLISTLGYGDRVDALVTFSTPHRGTRIADVAARYVPGDSTHAAAILTNFFLGKFSSSQANLGNQFRDLSQAYTTNTFNPQNPDDPRVRYFSIAGKTQPWLRVDTAKTDIVHASLWATFWTVTFLDGPNDGMVPVASAQWGTYLGEIPADHLDEVGLPLGASRPAFNPPEFYVKLLNFLEGGSSPIP